MKVHCEFVQLQTAISFDELLSQGFDNRSRAKVEQAMPKDQDNGASNPDAESLQERLRRLKEDGIIPKHLRGDPEAYARALKVVAKVFAERQAKEKSGEGDDV